MMTTRLRPTPHIALNWYGKVDDVAGDLFYATLYAKLEKVQKTFKLNTSIHAVAFAVAKNHLISITLCYSLSTMFPLPTPSISSILKHNDSTSP